MPIAHYLGFNNVADRNVIVAVSTFQFGLYGLVLGVLPEGKTVLAVLAFHAFCIFVFIFGFLI